MKMFTGRSMSAKRFGAAWIVALGMVGFDAQAQSVNYGALEQLFGEPVTTSATGSPQRVSDVPVTMEIVTAEQIRRSGAYDLPGVLRHVLGVDFQQWTNDQAEISVRGYDQPFSQRVLVLIDGRQVYADYFSFTPWSTLPVELGAIRQIEVVKGPGSALFGFNAVGGVINIITYSPLHDDVDTASVSGGTQALAQGSAVMTFRGPKAGLRISAGGRSDEDFNTPIPPLINLDPEQAVGGVGRANANRRSVDLDGAFQLGDRAQARINASYTEAEENGVNPIYSAEISDFRTHSVRAELSWDSRLGLLQTSAYTNWIEQEAYPGVFGSNFDHTNRVTVVQLQDLFKPGTRHTLRVALEYRDDSGGTTPIGGAHVFYHVLSASGMWEWRITPSVTLTNAARFDDLALGRDGFIPAGYPFSNADWDRAIHEVSFNSGLVWKPGDRDTLRLIAARGVLLPNLFNLGTLLAVTPFIGVSGLPTIEPTVVTHYEAGWHRSLADLTAQLDANLFYQETTAVQSIRGEVIQTASVPYTLPGNIGNSRTTGIELGLSGTLRERWRWKVNARLQDVADRFIPRAEGGTVFTDYEHVTPDAVINASAGLTSGPWEADGYVRYQSHTSGVTPLVPGLMSRLVPIPAHVTADARVGYTWSDRITAAVSGQNLTHSRQRQTSGAEVERRIFATVTMRF